MNDSLITPREAGRKLLFLFLPLSWLRLGSRTRGSLAIFRSSVNRGKDINDKNRYPQAQTISSRMSILSSWLRLGGLAPKKLEPCPCVSHDSLAIVEKAEVLRDQKLEERAAQVQNLVRRIVDTHAALLRLPHLRPGKIINQLLGDLVTLCSEIYDREVIDAVCVVFPCHRQVSHPNLRRPGPLPPRPHSNSAISAPNLRSS